LKCADIDWRRLEIDEQLLFVQLIVGNGCQSDSAPEIIIDMECAVPIGELIDVGAGIVERSL
jgi:hypothetical protein